MANPTPLQGYQKGDGPGDILRKLLTLFAAVIRGDVGGLPYVEPRTEFAPNAATSLAAGGGLALDGTVTGNRIRRKSVVVSNLDAAGTLQLRDASGNVGLTVQPSTSITLPISEYVQVWNPTAAPINCNVAEIWWTK